MGEKIIFDPPWMRQRAADCDAEKKAIQDLLGPADNAVDKLRRAATGWTFLDSLDEMSSRWENLNKLLRHELEQSADRIRDAADHHGKNENLLEKAIDALNPFD
jgi:uncharacterized protein YukE